MQCPKGGEVIKVDPKTLVVGDEFIVFAGERIAIDGGCGIVGMWGAVFADVGVALVAICNALRALIVKKNKKNK